ncbi:MAG TPA: hypothetical protein VHV08_04810, partial [Pirellulales bacterium]|nr:hypothetical protein [Pirellulales bacterium]
MPKLPPLLRHLWPFFGAVAVFLAVSAVLVEQGRRRCDGNLIYPLDDAYIHMAIARNLAAHGTWGVTPDEFSSTSSAPLWTLLLAGVFVVTGPSVVVPLALNIAFGTGLLLTAWYFGRRQQWSGRLNFAVLMVMIFWTPLPTLALLGMEHVLQAWAAVALVCVALELFGQDHPTRP